MTWKRAVFALFAVAAGTNVPTPLLLVYQERLGLSAEVLTALFGCYAAGLVPALLLAGQRKAVAMAGSWWLQLGITGAAFVGAVLAVMRASTDPAPRPAAAAASAPGAKLTSEHR